MRRANAFTVTLAVLLAGIAGSALAAPFLQPGYDAARTGNSPDRGPATDDVALRVQLPGSRALVATPLLYNGSAYVLLEGGRVEGLETHGIAQVDLATGASSLLASFEDPPRSWAADGASVYVLFTSEVGAYDLATGQESWRVAIPVGDPLGGSVAFCTEPALRDGLLYIGCSVFVQGGSRLTVRALALQLEDGQAAWTWTLSPGEAAAVLPDPTPAAQETVYGLSVVGAHAIVTAQRTTAAALAGSGLFQAAFYALDAGTGALDWSRQGNLTPVTFTPPADGPTPVPLPEVDLPSALPTGSPLEVFVKLDGELLALNPGQDGAVLWRAPLGREDTNEFQGVGSGFAYDGAALFAASAQTLYRFDSSARTAVWRVTLDPGLHETFGTSGLVLAEGVLYARSVARDPGAPWNALYAIDARTGESLWRHELHDASESTGGRRFEFAVGEGVLAAAGFDGSLTVLGQSAASPSPTVGLSNRYPDPGETVRADLSGSRSGANGPVVAYRAVWGDGTETNWTGEPVLTHRYEAVGDHIARFQVRTENGETGSEFVLFHVGSPAPTFLERAFAAERQDTTWGVIGLLVAATGTTVGVARLKTRRTRLKQELAAIEDAFALARGRPSDVEAALAERRAHARGLLVDGRLDEAQVQLLEHRIDELAREARLSALDERFDHLPMGMVRRLEAMLEDGHVSRWERDHFYRALEEETLLTEEQKAQVKRLIESWFEADAGTE